MGMPSLLAWQTEREFLLRELTDEDAQRLRKFCLESQAERADAAIQEARLVAAQSQLGLFWSVQNEVGLRTPPTSFSRVDIRLCFFV